jgi:hypothetical protein
MKRHLTLLILNFIVLVSISQVDTSKIKNNKSKINFLLATYYCQYDKFNLNTNLKDNSISTIPLFSRGTYLGIETIRRNFTLDYRFFLSINNDNRRSKLTQSSHAFNLGYKFKFNKYLDIQPYLGYSFTTYNSKINIFNDNKNIIANNISNSSSSLMELYLYTSNLNVGLKSSIDDFKFFINYNYQIQNSEWKSDFNNLIGFPKERVNYFQVGLEYPIKIKK